jgi:hypothetical protein
MAANKLFYRVVDPDVTFHVVFSSEALATLVTL